MDMIAYECDLPRPDLTESWNAIKLAESVRARLLAQSVLALVLRRQFSFEAMPIHGLIVLSGVPGTGKTTLARGLANQVVDTIKGEGSRFIQIDPHALTSSSLGKSQKEVSKLFQQTIPEAANNGPCIVLLDEVETLAPDRQRMSLEANPIDVHRATDAALAGLDLLARESPNVLLISTTNFPGAVDRALMSRADWVEEFGLPDAETRGAIISDTLEQLSTAWPDVARRKKEINSFVDASDGLDGRRIRKAVVSSAAVSVEIAEDLNKLQADHVITTLKDVVASTQGEEVR